MIDKAEVISVIHQIPAVPNQVYNKNHTYSQNSLTGDFCSLLSVPLQGAIVKFVKPRVALRHGLLYSERQFSVFHQLSQLAHGRMAWKELKR